MRRIAALLLLAVPPAVPHAAGAQRNDAARFDWFEYTGHDSVFTVHRPKADEYQNPILAGFYPDPSVVRRGDDYYLVTSSFAYYPGVPIFHSRDLVHWTQIGSVLDRPSQLELARANTVSRGIFAPTIREHAGTFYMITTVVDRGNFIVTATNAGGPWSDPIWLPELEGAIDPSLFFDDDGRAYVVNNGPPQGRPLYEGHRAIWVQEYDVAAKKMKGARTLLVNGGVDIAKHPIWIEAPHILKHAGKYYLICAEGGTADQHSEVVFRADAPTGPYAPGPVNPILTQRQLDASQPNRPFPVTSTGHADFVDLPNGDTWAVFLGVRPYGDNLYNTGRETWLLPVRWVDGWPRILDGDATVPYVAKRPKLPAVTPAKAGIPTTGNFTVRDEFTAPTLAPYWSFLRTPRAKFYDVSNGALALYPDTAHLGARTHLAFVGRRQQHVNATATTAVRYTPRRAGDEAGLVAFEHDDFNYCLCVALKDGKRVVQVVERAGKLTGDSAVVLASAPITTAPDAPIQLRITARGARYDFAYAASPGRWATLKRDADGTILSTKTAGGFSSNFVGVLFAMYAATAPR